jgi:signal transduction histidine kinase
VETSPAENAAVRRALAVIENLLSTQFNDAWSRESASLKARVALADLIERHFDGILDQWERAVEQILGPAHWREDLHNTLVRFVAHLNEPENIEGYVVMRRHCQVGMLAQADPSQFNMVHIALKQTILRHVRIALRGRQQEIVRDAVVAAIDELRMMVSGFYIESREAALRASEEKYRNSIDRAPDPMWQLDPETFDIIGANSAAESLAKNAFHFNGSNSLIGQPITELVDAGIANGLRQHLLTVVEKGTAQAYDLPLSEGRYFDVNSALIPFGNERFIQVILHDVTEKREMMEELLKAERLAAAGTFAAGVAHEVNNPLASISSLMQSLLSGEADSTRRTTMHTILSQITRISSTLKDLVDFARPSATQRRSIDLNALITETLRLLAYNKRFQGITLETQLAPDLRQVFADNNEIQQVLLNLLLNAADAIQCGAGRIRIETENTHSSRSGEHPARVVMRIIDNGIGIPREHLERVFEPFFTTKPAGAGAGLGLSLCQRIVLANRGNIRIDSEVGKGTTIKIFLPAFDLALQKGAAQASAVQ